MADTPETPPADDTLTPEEERKFSNFLKKNLPTTQPPAPTPAPASGAAPVTATAEPIQGGSSLKDLIKNALDEREASKAKDSKLDQLTKEVEELKKGKQKKGWSPFSPFNY